MQGRVFLWRMGTVKGRDLRQEGTKHAAGCLADLRNSYLEEPELKMGLSTLPRPIPLLSCYTYSFWNSRKALPIGQRLRMIL